MSDGGALAPWLALAGLGAYHGVNPGMGWLFAVALGLQEGKRSAVLAALVPIALGHEAAVAVAVIALRALEAVVGPQLVPLRLGAAALLVLFGAYKLLRPGAHPRWVGMRVKPPELALWSFLMASAHGAGLMLVPLLLGWHAESHAHAWPLAALGASGLLPDAAAVLVHTLAMLGVMGAVALLVYERLGVTVLRRAWVNLDLLWAAAFVGVGLATLFS
jgi:hypothetical protein